MREYVHDLTDEQVGMVLAKLADHATLANVIKECTPRGKGGSIKSNKPKDGVMAYIWRMARFHNGTDVTMPMMCSFDLGKGIEALTGIPLCISLIRPNVRKVLDFCDVMADELVAATGGNKNAAALRWGQAFGKF